MYILDTEEDVRVRALNAATPAISKRSRSTLVNLGTKAMLHEVSAHDYQPHGNNALQGWSKYCIMSRH